MPPLNRPLVNHSIEVPSMEALVAGETDVLVVGAGPAGLGAAIGAARTGAEWSDTVMSGGRPPWLW
jgi:ribulose 1,5-bisphosphate synthetase/thiazole synthase